MRPSATAAIVTALAGSLLQMKFDPAFIPVNASITSLTEAIQKTMYSDKEMMDWNATFHELIVGGLIHEGCFKIVRCITRCPTFGK